jgi:hypothetical protein
MRRQPPGRPGPGHPASTAGYTYPEAAGRTPGGQRPRLRAGVLDECGLADLAGPDLAGHEAVQALPAGVDPAEAAAALARLAAAGPASARELSRFLYGNDRARETARRSSSA